MGSFTTAVSRKLLSALFPNNGATPTSLTTSSLLTNASNLRIYNIATDAAGNVGVFCSDSTSSAAMRHGIHLIKGVGATAGTASGSLTDANFTVSGFTGTVTGGITALQIPNSVVVGEYSGYAMQVMSAPAAANGAYTWKGWTLDSSANKVWNEGQITFPQSTGSTNPVIIGFLITGDVGATPTLSTANNGSATFGWVSSAWSAANVSGTAVIAYGDLSSYRAIQLNDTPIFTGGSAPGGTTAGAIQITLD